jgi:hypothetical protein
MRNAGLLQLVLDLSADVGDAGDALDGLADDGDEPSVGALCFGEEVGDAAVAWDGDVELLVGVASRSRIRRGSALRELSSRRGRDRVGPCPSSVDVRPTRATGTDAPSNASGTF